MEEGNDRPKLSDSSDTDEAGGDANEGTAATFNTKQLESACLNVNGEGNDNGRCNHDELEDRKHEQSERSQAITLNDELDFLLPRLSIAPSDSPKADDNYELADRRYEPCEPSQVNNRYDDELDLRLPSPPSSSPKADDNHESADKRYEPCERFQRNDPNAPPADDRDCAPVSTANVNSISSGLSERNSYTWSLASSDLPSLLTMNDGNERLIWPVEIEFPDHIGFEENTDYILIALIAEGAFGKCYLAAELPEDKGRRFCVKKCQCGHVNELLALSLARKENVAEIVQFYGAKLQGRSASIFMEFIAGGTIAELIKEINKEVAEREVVLTSVILETDSLGYLEDVLKALNFIHMKGIVHRDVKGANVLLTEDRLHAKLADFGSAESCQNASASIDIWKTGCLFLEMWNGERPSHLLGVSALGFQRQTSCKPEDHIPSAAKPETKDLLRLCFGVNASQEIYLPSAAEVLEKSDVFPVKEFLKKY